MIFKQVTNIKDRFHVDLLWLFFKGMGLRPSLNIWDVLKKQVRHAIFRTELNCLTKFYQTLHQKIVHHVIV